jgi:hypothetical protein
MTYAAPSRRAIGLTGLLMTTLMLSSPLPAAAQGIDDPAAVEAIIGTPVQEKEHAAKADTARLIEAIDRTPEAISAVRKTSSLDKVDIVFLPDAAATEGGPPPEIESKIAQRQKDIDDLRTEIEGNAMLYHAINSRQILPRDILAVSFDKDGTEVVIYAAAKPPVR